MEILQGVWKQHLRPRAVVGYSVKTFLPSLQITSPDHLDKSFGMENVSLHSKNKIGEHSVDIYQSTLSLTHQNYHFKKTNHQRSEISHTGVLILLALLGNQRQLSGTLLRKAEVVSHNETDCRVPCLT